VRIGSGSEQLEVGPVRKQSWSSGAAAPGLDQSLPVYPPFRASWQMATRSYPRFLRHLYSFGMAGFPHASGSQPCPPAPFRNPSRLRLTPELPFTPAGIHSWLSHHDRRRHGGLAMRRICCSARENCRITVSNSILAFHLLGSSRTIGFRASAVRVGRQKAGATKPVLIAASIASHTGQRRRESSNARRVGRQEHFHLEEGSRNRLSSHHRLLCGS